MQICLIVSVRCTDVAPPPRPPDREGAPHTRRRRRRSRAARDHPRGDPRRAARLHPHQAAEALGISRSTLNRLLPFLELVELPWGTKLSRSTSSSDCSQNAGGAARRRREPRPPDVPRALPPELVRQIRTQRAAGKSLASIAADLNANGPRRRMEDSGGGPPRAGRSAPLWLTSASDSRQRQGRSGCVGKPASAGRPILRLLSGRHYPPRVHSPDAERSARPRRRRPTKVEPRTPRPRPSMSEKETGARGNLANACKEPPRLVDDMLRRPWTAGQQQPEPTIADISACEKRIQTPGRSRRRPRSPWAEARFWLKRWVRSRQLGAARGDSGLCQAHPRGIRRLVDASIRPRGLQKVVLLIVVSAAFGLIVFVGSARATTHAYWGYNNLTASYPPASQCAVRPVVGAPCSGYGNWHQRGGLDVR